MSDDFDVDEFLDGYKPRVEVATVCMRGDLLAKQQRMDEELNNTEGSENAARLSELADQLAEIEAEIDAAYRTFTFQAIAAEEWADLMRAHPPSKEQLEQKPGLDNNPDTFWPAAIETCAVSPEVTKAQAEKLRKVLRPADWDVVCDAVLVANQGVVLTPKSELATVIRQLRDASSTTSGQGASLAPSSSDGNGEASPTTSTTTTGA